MIPGMGSSMQDLIFTVWHRQALQYINTASIALLFYDYFLVFSFEVEYIWNSRWTAAKFLYFCCRYSPCIDSALLLTEMTANITDMRACKQLYAATGLANIIGSMISNIVLILRSWVLWNRDLKVFIGLNSIFVTYLTLTGITAADILTSRQFYHFQGKCFVSHQSSHVSGASYLCQTLLDTVVLVVTLYKAYHYVEEGFKSRLLNVIIRDGVLFYLLFTGLSLASAILLFTMNKNQNALVTLHRILFSILTSRVILNIRRASYIEAPSTPSGISGLSAAIRFASSPGRGDDPTLECDELQMWFGGPTIVIGPTETMVPADAM